MVLYKAGPQLQKVHFINILSILCAGGSVWWGSDLAQTYGLNPGDGGVLAPTGVRMAWGAGVMLPGIVFVVGMWLYRRNYVALLEFDESTRVYTVRHVSSFGTRKTLFRHEDIVSSRFHDGRLPMHMQFDAPWWTFQLAGHSKPLILDAQ
jgi:hypothetical protein